VLNPAQHDLTYLPNSAALPKAVDSELATQIVLLNPQRELESGESWPLARARLEQRLGTAD